MKAHVFTGNGEMEIIEKEKPVASGNTVVVKVISSGICGTDIELLLPAENPSKIVPGHEVVGIVEETDITRKFKAGDRVLINCHITCGNCEHCKNGDLIFCPELEVIGFDRDGGNEEYMAVPESCLRALPDDISDDIGVLIGDAVGTPYHAVKKADIRENDYVGIFGVGPLGTIAVMVAKYFKARVVAVDLNGQRLEKAEYFGADYIFNPQVDDIRKEIFDLTGGKGLDKIIQCAPSQRAIISALDVLKLRGKLIQVGVCTELTINPMAQIIEKEIEIIGSRNFNDNELDEIIDFVRKTGKIDELITHRFGLEDIIKAYDFAVKGIGLKILIKPNP